jgi:hypothetical protein
LRHGTDLPHVGNVDRISSDRMRRLPRGLNKAAMVPFFGLELLDVAAFNLPGQVGQLGSAL